MKIHFCDLCNESVPQADLDQGRAFIRKDRVICATCEGAMSHPSASSPAARPSSMGEGSPVAGVAPNRIAESEVAAALPAAGAHEGQPHVSHLQPIVVRSAGSGGLWVALLGLVFTAGVMFVLDDRIQSIQRDAGALEKRVTSRESDLGMLKREAALATDSQRQYERTNDSRFDTIKVKNDRVVEQVNAIARDNAEISARLASMTVLVNKHEAKAGAGDIELEKRMADLSARLARNEDDLRALTARLLSIETAPAPAAPVTAEVGPPPVPSEASWTPLLEGLKNDLNSTRWEAVTGLGATKDPEVVPHLLPMLKDLDVFVRMATARVLGEMQAKPAVPALIDALEDSETAVREAAFIALRTITGKDLKFDPQAIDAERAKRVKAWRDWWKKETETPSGT